MTIQAYFSEVNNALKLYFLNIERIQKFVLQKASHDSTQTFPGHCFMHNHSNNDIFENIAVGIGWCIWYPSKPLIFHVIYTEAFNIQK